MNTSSHSTIQRSFSIILTATLLATLALGVLPQQVAQATTIVLYAKPAPAGLVSGACQMWSHACDLQYALSIANPGTQIWVAAGTYKPTSGTDRTLTFQLKSGVALYGGFAGIETLLSQRDPLANPTLLSGEIGASADASDNSYNVVTGSGTDSSAVLDGFTITGGYNKTGRAGGNGSGKGAGMYNNAGSPTISNISFSGNSADAGGGMYNLNSIPTLTNVTFTGNSATNVGQTGGLGGGLYNESSNITLTDVNFNGNSAASYGGGMYIMNSDPTLTGVTFIDNTSTNGHGGGIFNHGGSPTLTNVTFSGNTAGLSGNSFLDSFGGGAGMGNNNGSPVLTNVTFFGNTGFYDGGGILSSGSGTPIINNSILWENREVNDEHDRPSQINGHVTVSDSVVQGGCPSGSVCSNVINVDPLLGASGIYGGSLQVFPLLPGSSAIDAGNPSTCASTDQRGVPRPQVTKCDMGAYESRGFMLAISAGDYQSAPAGTDFAELLEVGISSLYSEPVEGGVISFTPPASGASATVLPSPATIMDGKVRVNATANIMIGGFVVMASTAGAASPAILHLTNTLHSGILRVTPGGTLSGACNSWASACNLQYALNLAVSGNELWVAEGTYTPGANRSDTFQLKSGVGLYGGFAGTEASRSQRNPGTNVTSLSGEIGAAGNSDNSYHVVTGSGTDATASMDGFTITLGNASGTNPDNSGGGIYNDAGSPSLTNLTFSNNSARSGGGMVNRNGSNPGLSNVTFSGNSATYGGGMDNISSSPTLTNITFSGNSALTGAGMENDNNSAPHMNAVTFRSNHATSSGGGIYNSSSNPTIYNSILWGNTATNGAQIYNSSSAPDISYSDIQGGCPTGSTCSNVVSGDPLFGSLGFYGGSTQVLPLLPGSAAIDKGDIADCPFTDQRGINRPQHGICDMGAFESRGFTQAITGGNNQDALLNNAFDQPLSLSVSSATGEPVDGGIITFTAPLIGASASLSSNSVTIASGAVSVNATANGVVGAYDVLARASGVSPSITFHLHNQLPGFWSALGTGTENFVLAIAVSGSDVYVGGYFANAGGVPDTNNIAKWDTITNTWSALGTGTNDTVDAIAVSGSDVYVGGSFTNAGGVENTSRIAKWNSSTNTWEALGTGMSDTVQAIAVNGSDVYAGGDFYNAGSCTSTAGCNRIAKWNGSTWSPLGTGADLQVLAIAVSGSAVYVGGAFTSVGGVANTNHIAKWDTTTNTWSPLDTGTDGTVMAIAVSGSAVYVGGGFTSAGGVAANNLAKWNGISGWSALGTGTNDTVWDIAINGSELYLGGDFTSAGGVAVNYIAKLNGSTWSPLGTGTQNWVRPIAVNGSNVYAGGFFTSAGGVANTSHIARWNGGQPFPNIISGKIYKNSVTSGNTLAGALVQVCAGEVCQTASTDANGHYSLTGLPDGSYTLKAFPPAGLAYLPGTIGPLALSGGAVLSGQDILLVAPTPLPAGTTLLPSREGGGGVPSVYWNDPLVLTTQGCTDGTADYQILQGPAVIASGSMSEEPPGTYRASLAPLSPDHGNAHVVITLICSSGTNTTEGDIYIDPSGIVKTTSGSPLAGATVSLFRSDTLAGPFSQVPDGSGIMSPSNQNNPGTTEAAGLFGWDVVAGYYKVRAEKAGCVSPTNPGQAFVETNVMQIPPPVTDLELVLSCGYSLYLPLIIR